MPDKIGYLSITGEAAKRLFNKQSPGTTMSVRVKGTVQSMAIPDRGFHGQPSGFTNQLPNIIIEVEEVQD